MKSRRLTNKQDTRSLLRSKWKISIPATWVGIDVSKATLDVYIRPMGKALKVANTELEIATLVEQLKSYNLNLVVLEATGGLETEVVIQLQAALLPVALINPRLGRDFAKATGKLAKTDAIDAQILAHFGEAMKPRVLEIESESARQRERTHQP